MHIAQLVRAPPTGTAHWGTASHQRAALKAVKPYTRDSVRASDICRTCRYSTTTKSQGHLLRSLPGYSGFPTFWGTAVSAKLWGRVARFRSCTLQKHIAPCTPIRCTCTQSETARCVSRMAFAIHIPTLVAITDARRRHKICPPATSNLSSASGREGACLPSSLAACGLRQATIILACSTRRRPCARLR